MNLEDILGVMTGLMAVVLSLSIPIVAIVMVFVTIIKQKRRETELRLAIVQQGTDAETARALIAQQPKKNDRFSTLRWGCIFIGVGLGALCDALLGLSAKHDIYFWLIIAAGMGLGLLTAFIIEYRLTRKEQQESATSAAGQQPEVAKA